MDVRKRRKGPTGFNQEHEPLISRDIEDEEKKYVPRNHRASFTEQSDSAEISGTMTRNYYSLEYITQFMSSFWGYVSFFWSEFRKLISSSSNRTLPDIDPVVKQRMSDFQKYISVPFNIEDPSHYDELVRLWSIFFKDEPFVLSSPLWKKLGFQSDNPLTDFRACGFFGLKNLLYFAEKYPAKFQTLADIQEQRSGEYYPFAVASFNVTMLICELLGWGWKRPGVSTAKDPTIYSKLVKMLFPDSFSIEQCENVFFELYCLALVETDQEWIDSHATYMDFPVVLTNTQTRLERLLHQFSGIEDLYQHNQTHLILG